MYETISQAGMKSAEQIKSKNVDVNVISHKKQRYAVWFGGSLLADLVCSTYIHSF
jgi:actin-related protein 3